MHQPVLQIKDLNFSYGPTVILKNINLSLYKDDFLGLIGPNGGGKTTLLKLILGLLKPQSGEISMDGEKASVRISKKIGYVPQILNFEEYFPITVEEVVLTGRLGSKSFVGYYNKEDYKIAADCLNKVGLTEFAKKHLAELSGGEKQRVYIARALACQPKLLLLDEPTSNIDRRVETVFYDLLALLNKDIPIIIVSHDIGAVSSQVNKIACLNRELFYHDSKELTPEMLENVYHCPIDLIAHGVAHRVFDYHERESE
jgi:zinc transport system ATP-binding protein